MSADDLALQGIHLIKHAAWRTLERGGQFVLLGSAPDGRVQVIPGVWVAARVQCSLEHMWAEQRSRAHTRMHVHVQTSLEHIWAEQRSCAYMLT